VLDFHERSTLYCADAAMPMPVNDATAGEFEALLTREILAEAAPLLCGVNCTVTGALCPDGIVMGNDTPARVNSGLVVVAEETTTLAPAALRVADMVLLLPIVTLPRLALPGVTVKLPAACPTPASGIGKLGSAALEAMRMSPLVWPLVFGAKVTVNVMLAPGLKLRGGLRPLKPNPLPVTLALEIVMAELPALVRASD